MLLTNGNLIERTGVTSINPFSKVIGISVDSLYDGDNTIIGRGKDGIFYKIGGKLNSLWSWIVHTIGFYGDPSFLISLYL